MDRPEPPLAGDELTTVLGSLERQRATFGWKCSGVDAQGLAATVGASSMTLGGLLLHMALVEDVYFAARLAGQDIRQLWPDGDPHEPGWEWDAAAGVEPDVLLERWQTAVRRSRGVLGAVLAQEAAGLDHRTAHTPWDEPPSLRRVLADLVEEYARHVGHADLLREAVDGTTGEDPPDDLPGYPR